MHKTGQRQVDMLNGSIWDKTLMFALPLAATGILQHLFNAADVAVVGQCVGKQAMAAVGSNTSIINLFINLFVGISLGTNVLISQYHGAGDREGIKRAVHTAVVVALVGGVSLALIGQAAARPVVKLLGVPDNVAPMSELYFRIYMMGMPVILLYNFEAAIFRSRGDTKTPLAVLSAAGVINVALNFFFVVKLNRSVDGVAIATVASNLISAGVLFFLLVRSRAEVHIDLRALRVDWATLLKMMKIGVPAGVQSMVFSLANVCVQSAINSLGDTVMAASTAASNIETMTFQILTSFGQACTTFTGQNCGAGNLKRCHRGLFVTLVTGQTVMLLGGAVVLTLARGLLGIFNSDPEVIEMGLLRVRYMYFGQLFYLILEVVSGYMRGFGLSIIPAVCSLVFICGIRITWVFAIFPSYQTYTALMLVYPVSLTLTACIIAAVCFVLRKKIDGHVKKPEKKAAAS